MRPAYLLREPPMLAVQFEAATAPARRPLSYPVLVSHGEEPSTSPYVRDGRLVDARDTEWMSAAEIRRGVLDGSLSDDDVTRRTRWQLLTLLVNAGLDVDDGYEVRVPELDARYDDGERAIDVAAYRRAA